MILGRLCVLLLAVASSTGGHLACKNKNTEAEPPPTNDASQNSPTPSPEMRPRRGKTASVTPEDLGPPAVIGSAGDVNTLCADPTFFGSVSVEYGVICQTGQLSQVASQALLNPYRGVGSPPLIRVYMASSGSTTELIFLTALEVARPLSAVMQNLNLLPSGTVSASNATISQQVVATRPPAGGSLGSADIRSELTVKSIITVSNVSLYREDLVPLTPDQSMVVGIRTLIPGAPDNADDILGNSLNFLVGSGQNTLVISVNHSIINNRGMASLAEKTATEIALALMADAFAKLSQ